MNSHLCSSKHLEVQRGKNNSLQEVVGEIAAVRNILRAKPSLLNAKLFGFEGHDVYEVIPDV